MNIFLAFVGSFTTEQTGLVHGAGVLSLARTDPGTASGAAFFYLHRL